MIVITGGAGFVGSVALWMLNERGQDEVLLVDDLGKSEKWRNLVRRRYLDYMHKDSFLDLYRRRALPQRPRAVIHLGACSSTTQKDAGYLMENNFHYSRDLCRLALDDGARFINASSAATYGDGSRGFDDDPEKIVCLRPLNVYGYSKQLMDLWLKREGLDREVASLKFFNIYGPNEYHKGDMASVAYRAFGQIAESGRARLFRSTVPGLPDGGQSRDFVYVKDCARVILHLLDNPGANGILNVGTGRSRSFRELARAIFRAMNRPEKIEYVDMPADLAARYQNHTRAENSRLLASGYTGGFMSLEDGIADYVRILSSPDPYL